MMLKMMTMRLRITIMTIVMAMRSVMMLSDKMIMMIDDEEYDDVIGRTWKQRCWHSKSEGWWWGRVAAL